jgi:hypothetical protein
MSPKRASKQQQQLNVDQFKLLKKLMDHLGKQINVPGSFWRGCMLPDERDKVYKVYKCTIINFSLAHKSAPDSSPRNAFKMQEMVIDCTGSHEESDLASTMYWIDYLMPFLRFYYDTFPAVGDCLAGAAEVASLARTGSNGVNDSASDGCASSATVTHTDVHPENMVLRSRRWLPSASRSFVGLRSSSPAQIPPRLLQQTKKPLTLCLMSSSGGRTRISRRTHST